MPRWLQRKGSQIAAVFLIAAALFGPQPSAAQVFNPKSFTLANGMTVVVIENNRAPIVTHMVWYKVGAADEPPGKSGIAHFLEHLMFKGTATIPPGEFSKLIAGVGGRDNAFTSYDYTGYFQNVPREQLEFAMRLEADRMANLRLTDDVVYPERDVIREERRQVVENRPTARLREQEQAALYLNHPYRLPIIGWDHEIAELTREDAVAWYRTWYTPSNAVLIVAGDVTVEAIKPLAEKYYGVIKSHPVPARLRPQEPRPMAARRVELKDPRVRQPVVNISWLAPSYKAGASEHAYALQVLAEILGGGATSRLYRALVIEKQLATSAGAWYEPDMLDQSSFGASASLRPGAEVAALEQALQAELQRFLEKGASDDEVERAEAWPARIGAVTPAQVMAAARDVLRPERSVTGVLLEQPGT